MRECGYELPVIFYREPGSRTSMHSGLRHSRMGADGVTWHPFRSAMQQTGDEFECRTGIVDDSC